jgi:hypothetical protein
MRHPFIQSSGSSESRCGPKRRAPSIRFIDTIQSILSRNLMTIVIGGRGRVNCKVGFEDMICSRPPAARRQPPNSSPVPARSRVAPITTETGGSLLSVGRLAGNWAGYSAPGRRIRDSGRPRRIRRQNPMLPTGQTLLGFPGSPFLIQPLSQLRPHHRARPHDQRQGQMARPRFFFRMVGQVEGSSR